jgi:hypothetical protein
MRKPQDPWRYQWSSHKAYLKEKTPVTIERAFVFAQFGRKSAQARAAYRSFMKDGLGTGHSERYYETVDQRFLGDEDFIREVEKQ